MGVLEGEGVECAGGDGGCLALMYLLREGNGVVLTGARLWSVTAAVVWKANKDGGSRGSMRTSGSLCSTWRTTPDA